MSCSSGWPQSYCIAEASFVCMCVRKMDMHCHAVEVRGQSWLSINAFHFGTVFSLWAAVYAVLSGFQVSKSYPNSARHCCWSAGSVSLQHLALCGSLGFKLRTLHSHSKHVSHRASSPALQPWGVSSSCFYLPSAGIIGVHDIPSLYDAGDQTLGFMPLRYAVNLHL